MNFRASCNPLRKYDQICTWKFFGVAYITPARPDHFDMGTDSLGFVGIKIPVPIKEDTDITLSFFLQLWEPIHVLCEWREREMK